MTPTSHPWSIFATMRPSMRRRPSRLLGDFRPGGTPMTSKVFSLCFVTALLIGGCSSGGSGEGAGTGGNPATGGDTQKGGSGGNGGSGGTTSSGGTTGTGGSTTSGGTTG